MQHLRAERCQFRCFVKADALDELRTRYYAWIGGKHAIHVRPDFDGGGPDGRANQRGRVIRSASAQRGRHAPRCRADEAPHHRNLALLQQRQQVLLGGERNRVDIRLGAREKVIRFHDIARINPHRGIATVTERRCNDSRGEQLAKRGNGVERAWRKVPQRPERLGETGELIEARTDLEHERFCFGRAVKQGVHFSQVTIAQLLDQLQRRE